jgi:hypothetical protein
MKRPGRCSWVRRGALAARVAKEPPRCKCMQLRSCAAAVVRRAHVPASRFGVRAAPLHEQIDSQTLPSTRKAPARRAWPAVPSQMVCASAPARRRPSRAILVLQPSLNLQHALSLPRAQRALACRKLRELQSTASSASSCTQRAPSGNCSQFALSEPQTASSLSQPDGLSPISALQPAASFSPKPGQPPA